MSIFVVSNSMLFSDVLKNYCESQNHKVCGCGSDLTQIEPSKTPDIVLLHTRDSDVEIGEQTRILASLPKTPKLVVISGKSSSVSVQKTLGSKVAAVLAEDISAEGLAGVLTVVNLGFRVVAETETIATDASDSRAVDANPSAKDTAAPADRKKLAMLSKREHDILLALAEGGSNKDIANRLGICEATVKVHLRTCYRKIGTKNRTQAAVWVMDCLGHP
ncbi:MAG: response regulator transcription factor [Pseudomonadota bacterium]